MLVYKYLTERGGSCRPVTYGKEANGAVRRCRAEKPISTLST